MSERAHPGERTFKFSNVVLDVGGDELADVVREFNVIGHRLRPQNGQAGFEVRWVNLSQEPRKQAASEAIFQGLD